MRPPTINPAEMATGHIAINFAGAANPANERAGEYQEPRSIA
jgi:hypothetical protein